MTRTALYRYHDAAGRLLYVGITSEFDRRNKEHAATQPWFGDVAYTDVKMLDSRAHAEALERVAIQFEAPLHNSTHQRPDVAVVASIPRADASGARKLAQFMAAQPKVAKAAWAELFDVSRPYLYSLSDGTRYPSLPVAERIREATNGAIQIADWPNLGAVVHSGARAS